MIDPNPSEEAFEDSLRQFSAAQPDPALRRDIAASLSYASPRSPWSDRFLKTAMSLGAAAAVLIITFHTMDAIDASRQPPPAPVAVRAQDAQIAEFLAALAAGKEPPEIPAALRFRGGTP